MLMQQQHRWTVRNLLPSLLIGSECLFKIKPDKWHVGGVKPWSTVFRKLCKGTGGEPGTASQMTVIKGFCTQAVGAAPLANWP